MTKGALVRLLYDAGASIGESPVWRDGCVWWTDPVRRQLLCLDGAQFQCLSVPQAIWSLAPDRDGWLVGSLDDRFARVASDGSILEGPAANLAAGCRFNDMATGTDGLLWVGAMHRGTLASRGGIFRASSIDETPRQVAGGLGVPNGMKLSPDGSTLFVLDTVQRTLLAYPTTPDGLREPIIVTDFLGLPGKPDGMTISENGNFWVAMWGGGSVVEIAPNGATLRQIDIPAPHVSSVCVAPDRRLIVSTSRMRLSPQALDRYPHSGGLFEVLVEDPL